MATYLITIVCLLGAPADNVRADAMRYRLTLPGFEFGQQPDAATLRHWRGWLNQQGYDVAGMVPQLGYVDIILRDGAPLAPLIAQGFDLIETERNEAPRAAGLRGGINGFVDPAALLTFLNGEVADHPTLTNLTSIGITHQGRDILCLEISNNPGAAEDKPAILINGAHHPREIVTPHVAMDVITYLTDQYVAGDPQVTDWVDNYKIFCIPIVNPDGAERVHNGGDSFHRKNLRAVCTSGNLGVDLNRNYPYHWGSGSTACERSPTGGSSGSTCSDAYRGASPNSEPETQAMIALAQQERFLVAVSYHASGQFIDYPYACNDGNPDNRMPEHDIIDELMRGMGDAIFAFDGINYSIFSPIAVGAVNGDDTSWYYAHNATYAMLIEIGTSFQPAFSTGMASVARNRPGWLYLLERMGQARIDVRVANHLTGEPIEAGVDVLNFTFDTDELPRVADPLFGRSRWLVPEVDTYTVQVKETGFNARTLDVPVGIEPVDLTVLLLPNGAVLGDSEGDGDTDLADFATFQICNQGSSISLECRVLDMNADEQVTETDLPDFNAVLQGPM